MGSSRNPVTQRNGADRLLPGSSSLAVLLIVLVDVGRRDFTPLCKVAIPILQETQGEAA